MPSPNGASILVPMAAAIASSLALLELEAARLPTVWIAIALGTVLTGLLLFVLGRFRLSYLIRFIPYPVVGGFLAGTGWLLTKGGTFIICGVLLSFAELHRFLDPSILLRFLPGLVLTVVLLVTERLYKHVLVFPALVLAVIIASFGFLSGVGVGIIVACFLSVVNYSHLNVRRRNRCV